MAFGRGFHGGDIVAVYRLGGNMRTLVDIPECQIQELATLCEEKKMSRAEAVRQAIAAYLIENRTQAMVDGFGLWAGGEITDGLKYQEDMRAEWDR